MRAQAIFSFMDFNQVWYAISAIFGLSVHPNFERFWIKFKKIWAMIDQNFKQIFSHAYWKSVKAVALKLLSVIYSPMKVDCY